jgi:hypothetical protein
MTTVTQFEALRDEERNARLRLQRFKAKLHAKPQLGTPASATRLNELQRRWELAAARLRAAKRPS